jgi:hypothetical protein
MLLWSPTRCLNDRTNIPRGRGIYLIGIHDASLTDLGKDKDYYGANYPIEFRPRYVGMTMSTTHGIASRIRSHARGRGNKRIKDHIDTHGIHSLLYTYSESSESESDFAEVLFLAHRADTFLDWNNKGELIGAIRRRFFQGGPPAPMYLDHWEPWEQSEEFEYKRQLAKNWNQLLDQYPKYKRMIKWNV